MISNDKQLASINTIIPVGSRSMLAATNSIYTNPTVSLGAKKALTASNTSAIISGEKKRNESLNMKLVEEEFVERKAKNCDPCQKYFFISFMVFILMIPFLFILVRSSKMQHFCLNNKRLFRKKNELTNTFCF